jgi:hypothetical protein
MGWSGVLVPRGTEKRGLPSVSEYLYGWLVSRGTDGGLSRPRGASVTMGRYDLRLPFLEKLHLGKKRKTWQYFVAFHVEQGAIGVIRRFHVERWRRANATGVTTCEPRKSKKSVLVPRGTKRNGAETEEKAGPSRAAAEYLVRNVAASERVVETSELGRARFETASSEFPTGNPLSILVVPRETSCVLE